MSKSTRHSLGRFATLHALLGRQRLASAGASPPKRRRSFQPRVEVLEDRVVPAPSWTNLAASGTGPGSGGEVMMLLSDGTVLVQNGSNPPPSASIFKLSPQANTGSYVNGVWSSLASMNQARLFFTTAMSPDGRVLAVGGEFPSFTNTAEIYNPVANTWTLVDAVPTADSKFGDDPIEVLSTGPNSGQILAGYYNSGTTYRFNPAAAAGSQWVQTAGAKLHNEFGGRTDRSDEEAWVKLKDGSILSYDIWASGSSNTFEAQRYVPSSDTWVNASTLSTTNPPNILESNGAQGRELGPAFLQPDGNVIYFGANGNTAIYNPTTNIWTAGPAEPTRVIGGVTTNIVATDDPGAVLPNGHILIALSPQGGLNAMGNYTFPAPSFIYEYDPVAQTFTDVSPGGALGGTTLTPNAFALNMVVLPTGQVLLATEGAVFQIFTEDPATGPQNAWRPTITRIVDNGGGTFTLTGTQLNGIDEGANYGDDKESASNYPIIQFKDASNNIFYGRTFNWSSTGVATGSTPVTVQFTLPPGKSLSDLTTVTVIANGIPSVSVPFHISPNLTPPATQTSVEGAAQSFNLGSFTDPDGGPWTVDVNWGDGTAHTIFTMASPGTITAQSHTYAEESPPAYTVTVKVTDNVEGQSDSKTFLATVSDPAVVATGVAVSAVEGAAFTGKLVATFTDPGGPELPVDGHYTATIDWGDSSSSAGTITYIDGLSKTFTVTGDHTYGEEGTYTVTTTINHEGTITVTTSTATVSDTAVLASGVDVSAKECIAFIAAVATFTDPGGAEPNLFDNIDGIPSHYTATIDWGDLTPASAGTITYSGVPLDDSKTNPFTVTGTHTFDEEGTFTIITTINHEGVISTVTSTATVRDNIGLLVLDPTGDRALMVDGFGNITVTHCGAVVVNSNDPREAAFLSGNATVVDAETDVTGALRTVGNASLSGELNTEAATPDPIALPLPPAPATTFAAVHVSAGSVTLAPGTYVGGITVDGTASVTLLAGVYYLNGGGFSVTSQGSVTGTNVLIVNAPTGPSDTITFAGTASVSLTAPNALTGAYAAYNHVTIFQDPASDNAISINGQANLTMTGVLYAPKALLKIGGLGNAVVSTDTPSTGGLVVVFEAKVTDNGGLTINADPADFSTPADAGSAVRFAAGGNTGPNRGDSSPRAATPLIELVAGNPDLALLLASQPLTGPAAPAGVIGTGTLFFDPVNPQAIALGPAQKLAGSRTQERGAPVAAPKVSPVPATVSPAANLGGGDEDGTTDAPLAPNDSQPVLPVAPATPVLSPQACDAIFAASDWAPVAPPPLAPATGGRVNADVAAPRAALGIAGDAPPALIAADGAQQRPSLLAAAGLALGLASWWSAPRRLEDEELRRYLLK